MKTAELKTTIDKMENLIRMQGIELDNTRNLLGRCLDAYEHKEMLVKRKDYDVPDDICFGAKNHPMDGRFIIISGAKLPDGMENIMQQITKLREELGV